MKVSKSMKYNMVAKNFCYCPPLFTESYFNQPLFLVECAISKQKAVKVIEPGWASVKTDPTIPMRNNWK